jgi:hypothetical protein
MSDFHPKIDHLGREQQTSDSTEASDKIRRPLSMHEDVPVWYDCCSCEAEPYWREQLGEPPGEISLECREGEEDTD